MPNIITEIIINAPAETVWSVLTAFTDYPEWNPFIRNIQGELKIGASLSVSIHPPGKKARRFHPTVVKITPYRELRWLGMLYLPEVFDGEHCFQMEPQENNTTKFIHSESFSGILSSALFPLISGATQQGFVAMNEALKVRCETYINKKQSE